MTIIGNLAEHNSPSPPQQSFISILTHINYRPRNEEDNALGSVCPSVCPFVCALTAEPFDLEFYPIIPAEIESNAMG